MNESMNQVFLEQLNRPWVNYFMQSPLKNQDIPKLEKSFLVDGSSVKRTSNKCRLLDN